MTQQSLTPFLRAITSGRAGFWLTLVAWVFFLRPGDAQLLSPEERRLQEGSELAHIQCVSCHLFPEPDAVDRPTWEQQILPRMKWRLGFTTPELDRSPNIRVLRKYQRIPLEPTVSEEQWLKLVDYYLKSAPTVPLRNKEHPSIAVGLPGFQTIVPRYRAANPSITAVKILPGGGAVVADDHAKEVRMLGPAGALLSTLQLGNSVSSFRVSGRTLVIAGLGSYLPSDETNAAVYLVSWTNNQLKLLDRPLAGLLRTTDALREDLNADGRLDYAVSSFGNNIGQFSWFEAKKRGGFEEHVLFSLPGTLRAEWADVNGDGRPDLVTLVAQETEALLIFPNLGSGNFDQRVVFQRPPYWGHSYFEVADFNGDKRPDFLVTNGDNGEFTSAPKRVHGIRIYTSQPDGTWQETFFFPMNGAYKAVARDFDRDGDLDIAAISFFPDYQYSPRESFVLLRNDGNGKFAAFTFPESALGRWICMDVGDFDGDGAEDILLGSYIKGPSPVPAKLMEAWNQVKLPVILLRNQERSRAPAR